MPVATLAKLFDARLKCDPEREAQAWRDLDALGIVLILDPARWGRTPRRHQAGRP